MEYKIKKSLDTDNYIKWFVKEFNLYFPNIFTPEELFKIIKSRVESIHLVDFKDKSIKGNYDFYSADIFITNENDKHILFHAFLHALRSYFYNTENTLINESSDPEYREIRNKFLLADSGITELIAMLYEERKRTGNLDVSYVKPKREDSFSLNMYGALAYNQFNLLYKIKNPNSDLISEYLKGGNVYKAIFELVYDYLLKMGIDNDEALETAFRLSNIILTYLVDFSEAEITDRNSIVSVNTKYATIEEICKNILLQLPLKSSEDHKLHDLISESFVFAKLPTPEERFLSSLLNKNIGTYSIEDINSLISEFVSASDEGRH